MERQEAEFYRTTSFLYTLNELLHLAVSPSSGLGGSSRVNVPSTRSLWMAKSSIAWHRQYAAQRSKRRFKKPLKIAQIREYTTHISEDPRTKDWVSDLDSWCSDHDDFGDLIWMATRLDPA